MCLEVMKLVLIQNTACLTREEFIIYALVEALDALLNIVRNDETHPLAGLTHQLGDLVSAYENEHLPIPMEMVVLL